MTLKPLRGRVAVKKTEADEATASGIILSKPLTNNDAHHQGTVIVVGDGVTEVKAGDKILFGQYSGESFKHDGQDLIMVTEGDIVAVIEG